MDNVNGNLSVIIAGAFFAYGMFTLQRRGFLLNKLTGVWKRLPKKLHEPIFDCGVCVSSFWGIIFIGANWVVNNYIYQKYVLITMIPFYIIAMCGICAVVDRAVKFFEYGYKYNSISPMSDYSYLGNYQFRDSLYECFLNQIPGDVLLVEIGGYTAGIKGKYTSIDKQHGADISKLTINEDYFVLIKGIAFEGNFDYLLNILASAKGFIIEGSVGCESGKQIQWIMDRFDLTVKIPYSVNDNLECRPDHCGNTNNRVVLIKPIK